MIFLKELEKKRLKASEVWNEDDEFYFNAKDVKEVFNREWRVFWEKRRGEIEKLRERYEVYSRFHSGEIHLLNNELSWIEKQLKEVKKKKAERERISFPTSYGRVSFSIKKKGYKSKLREKFEKQLKEVK